jgi:signal transduction histidine kinase
MKDLVVKKTFSAISASFAASLKIHRGAAEAAKNLPEQVRNRIGRARDVARQSLEEVRRSVLAMSSPLPVRGDLANSIRAFVSSYASTARTRVDFSVKGTSRHLGPAIEENLLRIAQQATDNALKHARASVIHIQLRFDEKTVRLSITDDGQGFDVKKESRGFGVTGMRERAREIGGKFRLDSKHGKGTRVEAAVPLSPARPPEASR